MSDIPGRSSRELTPKTTALAKIVGSPDYLAAVADYVYTIDGSPEHSCRGCDRKELTGKMFFKNRQPWCGVCWRLAYKSRYIEFPPTRCGRGHFKLALADEWEAMRKEVESDVALKDDGEGVGTRTIPKARSKREFGVGPNAREVMRVAGVTEDELRAKGKVQ